MGLAIDRERVDLYEGSRILLNFVPGLQRPDIVNEILPQTEDEAADESGLPVVTLERLGEHRGIIRHGPDGELELRGLRWDLICYLADHRLVRSDHLKDYLVSQGMEPYHPSSAFNSLSKIINTSLEGPTPLLESVRRVGEGTFYKMNGQISKIGFPVPNPESEPGIFAGTVPEVASVEPKAVPDQGAERNKKLGKKPPCQSPTPDNLPTSMRDDPVIADPQIKRIMSVGLLHFPHQIAMKRLIQQWDSTALAKAFVEFSVSPQRRMNNVEWNLDPRIQNVMRSISLPDSQGKLGGSERAASSSENAAPEAAIIPVLEPEDPEVVERLGVLAYLALEGRNQILFCPNQRAYYYRLSALRKILKKNVKQLGIKVSDNNALDTQQSFGSPLSGIKIGINPKLVTSDMVPQSDRHGSNQHVPDRPDPDRRVSYDEFIDRLSTVRTVTLPDPLLTDLERLLLKDENTIIRLKEQGDYTEQEVSRPNLTKVLKNIAENHSFSLDKPEFSDFKGDRERIIITVIKDLIKRTRVKGTLRQGGKEGDVMRLLFNLSKRGTKMRQFFHNLYSVYSS